MGDITKEARRPVEKPTVDLSDEEDEKKKRRQRAIPATLAIAILTKMIEEVVIEVCFLRAVPKPLGEFDIHFFSRDESGHNQIDSGESSEDEGVD